MTTPGEPCADSRIDPLFASIAYTFPAPSSATPSGTISLSTTFVLGATGVVTPLAVVVALSATNTDPEMTPPSARLPEAFCQLAAGKVTVSVAERRPTAEGVAVTVTRQSTELSPFCVHAGEVAVISGVDVKVAVAPLTAP